MGQLVEHVTAHVRMRERLWLRRKWWENVDAFWELLHSGSGVTILNN